MDLRLTMTHELKILHFKEFHKISFLQCNVGVREEKVLLGKCSLFTHQFITQVFFILNFKIKLFAKRSFSWRFTTFLSKENSKGITSNADIYFLKIKIMNKNQRAIVDRYHNQP